MEPGEPGVRAGAAHTSLYRIRLAQPPIEPHPSEAAEDDRDDQWKPSPAEEPWWRRRLRLSLPTLAEAATKKEALILMAGAVLATILLLFIVGLRGTKSSATSRRTLTETLPGEVTSDASVSALRSDSNPLVTARATPQDRAAGLSAANRTPPSERATSTAQSTLARSVAASTRRGLPAGSVGVQPQATELGGNPPPNETVTSRPPALAPGSPTPAYPPALRSHAISGRVVAEFVVNPNGRVDPSTFRVLESDDELFTLAVRQALPKLQFIPAEVDGRKVPQRLQLPFTFAAP
jgi:TonB family protein